MRDVSQQRLVDQFIEAYVEWREECDAVRAAYARWTRAPATEARWAFYSYHATLDLEEHASRVYASVVARIAASLATIPEPPGRQPAASG
jgi:hypothetical protein